MRGEWLAAHAESPFGADFKCHFPVILAVHSWLIWDLGACLLREVEVYADSVM